MSSTADTGTDDPVVVVGYLRLSQDDSGSLAAQRDAIKQYCRDRPQLRLQTILSDGEGASGFSVDADERPRYCTVMDKLAAGDINGVVTRDRDRLVRAFDARVDALMQVYQGDWEWHVVEAGGRLDIFSNPVETAMEIMRAGMDADAKRKEIERATKRMQERRERGAWEGAAPTGMEWDDNGRFVQPGEGWYRVLEAVAALRAGCSYRETADVAGLTVNQIRSIKTRMDEYDQIAREGGVLGRDGVVQAD